MTIVGLDGWRFAFITLAVISALIGAAIYLFGKDPVRGGTEEALRGVAQESEASYQISRADIKKIMTNRTYVTILTQGVIGTIPWAALAFLIAWFEYIGFDGFMAAIIFAVTAMGAAVGNMFGGMIGDKAARWNPDKGRILIAQISVASGIPLTIVIFWLLPRSTDLMLLYMTVGFLTGFMIIWTLPGTNNPIISEIFEPEIRSSAYAFDRLFEGSVAAGGTLVVGFLAQIFFGYIDTQGVTIADLPEATRMTNVNAIADAMVIPMVIPWIFCLILYTLVYITYPKDKLAAQDALLARREAILKRQQIDQL